MSFINVEPEINVEEMFNNTSPHLYVQYSISGSVIFYPPQDHGHIISIFYLPLLTVITH